MSGRLMSCSLPREEAELYKWVERAAVVPERLWLPKVDVMATIASFAHDQACKVSDVSRMFTALRGDAQKADTALVLLSERSLIHKDTLHVVLMSEYNVESLLVCDVLFQLRDVEQQLCDALVVGKHLLHGFCIFRGETVKLYDVKNASVVRSTLYQIEKQAECMICLDDLFNLNTVIPFACGHPICRACFQNAPIRTCAKCRSAAPWTSQSYLQLDDAVKTAAHTNGTVRVLLSRKPSRRTQRTPN